MSTDKPWWAFGIDEDQLLRRADREAWFTVRVFQGILAVCALLMFGVVFLIHFELYLVAMGATFTTMLLFFAGSYWLDYRSI